MHYKSYLLSDHWIELRGAKLEDASFRCERCRRKSNLEVHHKHYRSVGHESLLDLEVLCRECHQKHHDAQIPIMAPPTNIKKCPKEIEKEFRQKKYQLVSKLDAEFFAASQLGLKRRAEFLHQELLKAKRMKPPAMHSK